MSRVLVTGASGFIGRRTLAPLVEAGHEVHAVARTEQAGPAGVEWHTTDLLDHERRAEVVADVGASHLLHLAWYGEHGAFWTAPENLDWQYATLRLTDEFARAGGRRAVFAGSCAEYDWSAPGPLSEETTPLRPGTLYGAAKDATRRVAEQLVPELAWGRIFFLYGPGEGERRLVSDLARKVMAGERAAVSEGTQVRDFLYVDDVGCAFAALVGSGVTGAVNVGSGEGVAVRDLAVAVGRAAGDETLLDIGALPMRQGDPLELVADIRRLRFSVRWSPSISLEQGLAETVAWLRREAS